jgi:hypothetical protein
VQGGSYVVVYPQEFAEADFIWPTPAWSDR